MKKALFILVALVCLSLTNPTLSAHRAAVAEDMLASAKEEGQPELVSPDKYRDFQALTEHIATQAVSRKNYGLFSLTQVSSKSGPKVIGVGVLGQVYIKGDY